MLDIARYGYPGKPPSDAVYQPTRFIGGCYSKVGAEKSGLTNKIWAVIFWNTATPAGSQDSLAFSFHWLSRKMLRGHTFTLLSGKLWCHWIPWALIHLGMDTPGMCHQSLVSLLQYQLEYHLFQIKSCPSSSAIERSISDVEHKGVAVVVKNCHKCCFVDATPRINASTS